MPINSPVHKMYEALLREGHSKESAARIAQSQTGLALTTGRPPKGKGGRRAGRKSGLRKDRRKR
jgi:hypothetical protein